MLATLLDPQRVAEAAEDQAALRQIRGSQVATSPAQSKFLFGQARETKILQSIVTDDFTEGGGIRLTQLGEAYALQGRFADAAAITKSPTHQAEYEVRAKATASLGARLCLCPAFIFEPSKTDAKGTRVVTQQKIDDVYDGQRIISFFRCLKCGVVSAE